LVIIKDKELKDLLFFLSFVGTISVLMFIFFEFISLKIGFFTAFFCAILTLTVFAGIIIILDVDNEKD